jgi:hypothetical protein
VFEKLFKNIFKKFTENSYFAGPCIFILQACHSGKYKNFVSKIRAQNVVKNVKTYHTKRVTHIADGATYFCRMTSL